MCQLRNLKVPLTFMVPTFSHCFYPPMTLFLAYYKYDPQTCHLQFRSLSHLQLIVEFYPLRLRWLFGYGPAIKLVRVNTTSSGTNRKLFSIVTLPTQLLHIPHPQPQPLFFCTLRIGSLGTRREFTYPDRCREGWVGLPVLSGTGVWRKRKKWPTIGWWAKTKSTRQASNSFAVYLFRIGVTITP